MPRYIARRAILPLLSLAFLACSDDDGTGPSNPNTNVLSGTYELNDWTYVLYGDTLPMTENSYVRIEFQESGEVNGEGLVQLLQPSAGGAGPDTVTVLGVPVDGVQWGPQMLQGSHDVLEGNSDILRFTFDLDTGAGTWVENFDWLVAEDRSYFRFDHVSEIEVIEIVHRKQ
jgi:hypothetical protein